jgi:hypothetical protein
MCDESLEKNFLRIKEYIEQYPEACSASEVCLALELPLPLITFLLREERDLARNKKIGYEFKCEKCLKPVTSGRYCFECSIEVIRDKMHEACKMNALMANYPSKFHIR